MYWYSKLGNHTFARNRKLYELITESEVSLGGYQKGKIYGLINCKSGMRMKVENRVFFKNEREALALGYRPCGNCLPGQYQKWKASQKNLTK